MQGLWDLSIIQSHFKLTGETNMKTFNKLLKKSALVTLLASGMSISQAQNDYYNTNLNEINTNNSNPNYGTGNINQNIGYVQNQPNQQYSTNVQNPSPANGLGQNLYNGNNPNNNPNNNPGYNPGYNSGKNPNNPNNPNYNPNFNPNNPGTTNPNPYGNQPSTNNNELKDFGVQPTSQLYAGSPHGPTPSSIPGGKVITTNQLKSMVMSGQNSMLIFDVLNGQQSLPGAIPAVQAASPGSFSDQIQQMMGQYLTQATRGNKQTAMVFYCQSNYCWMSYNAALRAINLGYTNVYWYRGGIEAWQAQGLSVQGSNNYGYNNNNYQ